MHRCAHTRYGDRQRIFGGYKELDSCYQNLNYPSFFVEQAYTRIPLSNLNEIFHFFHLLWRLIVYVLRCRCRRRVSNRGRAHASSVS